MPSEYKVVQESDQDLKHFRIKVIELCLLTLTALFALLSINKNQNLLVPAIFFSVSMIVTLLALIWGANREVVDIEFENGNELVSPVKMTRMTYRVYAKDWGSRTFVSLRRPLLGF